MEMIVLMHTKQHMMCFDVSILVQVLKAGIRNFQHPTDDFASGDGPLRIVHPLELPQLRLQEEPRFEGRWRHLLKHF